MTEKITTAEELDALPVGSVVVDLFDNGEFHKMRTGRWIDTGGSRWLASEMVQDEQEYALYRPGAPTPPLQPEADREALRVALTDGYWQRTGYRANWEHIGPLMDAILDAGFTLAARQPAPTVSAEREWGVPDADGNVWPTRHPNVLAEASRLRKPVLTRTVQVLTPWIEVRDV